jgi:predicted secreted acid phosphatase
MGFIYLIDIDGTICEDIKNEDYHLFEFANPLPGALERCNSWYENGHQIHFFTARESKDRKVTEDWLTKEGFKYHSLVMDKPRIKDNQEYVWIDNKKVRAVTFKGIWSELINYTKTILTFKE